MSKTRYMEKNARIKLFIYQTEIGPPQKEKYIEIEDVNAVDVHTSLVPGLVLTAQSMWTFPSWNPISDIVQSSSTFNSDSGVDSEKARLSNSSYHCWAAPTCKLQTELATKILEVEYFVGQNNDN